MNFPCYLRGSGDFVSIAPQRPNFPIPLRVGIQTDFIMVNSVFLTGEEEILHGLEILLSPVRLRQSVTRAGSITSFLHRMKQADSIDWDDKKMPLENSFSGLFQKTQFSHHDLIPISSTIDASLV